MSSGLPLMEQPGFSSGQFGAFNFLIKQALAKLNTVTIVKVTEVNTDELWVSVQPLINMVNGNGEGVEYGIIPKIPFFIIRGGINEIQINPAVDDIGIAAFCSRDYSTVWETKEISNPGSRAQFSLSDGIYFGGVMNTAVEATNKIIMNETGVGILSTDGIITLTATTGIYLNGTKFA